MPDLQERRSRRFRAAEPTQPSDPVLVHGRIDEAAESSTPESSAPEDSAATNPEWFDMDDSPRDGAPVALLGPDGETAEARWLEKRSFTGFKWESVGRWYIYNAGGARVAFEPVAWTRLNL